MLLEHNSNSRLFDHIVKAQFLEENENKGPSSDEFKDLINKQKRRVR